MTGWTSTAPEAVVLVATVGAALIGLALIGMALFRHVRRRYVVVVVVGTSMLPTYAPGDRVLVRWESGVPARGDVVVVRKPDVSQGWPTVPASSARGGPLGRRWLIKRVAATGGDPWPEVVDPAAWDGGGETVPVGHVVLLGDNPRGTDSRTWGPCPEHQVLGRAIRRMGPAE